MKIYNYGGKAILIGPRLKMAREKKDLSQDNLAAKMQVENVALSQKAISRIEQQERFVTDYELRAFSQILGVEISWLLNGDDTVST